MPLGCVVKERQYIPGENSINLKQCCENAEWCVLYMNGTFDMVCEKHLPEGDPKIVTRKVGNA